MDESSNSKGITPELMNSPKQSAVTQPKTFKNLGKRGSIYKLFTKNGGDNGKNGGSSGSCAGMQSTGPHVS